MTREMKVLKYLAEKFDETGIYTPFLKAEKSGVLDHEEVERASIILKSLAAVWGFPHDMLEEMLNGKMKIGMRKTIGENLLRGVDPSVYTPDVLAMDAKAMVSDLPDDFWVELMAVTEKDVEVLKKNFTSSEVTLGKMLSGLLNTLLIDQLPCTVFPTGLNKMTCGEVSVGVSLVRDIRNVEQWWEDDGGETTWIEHLADDMGVVRSTMYVTEDFKTVSNYLDWAKVRPSSVTNYFLDMSMAYEAYMKPRDPELKKVYYLIYLMAYEMVRGNIVFEHYVDQYILGKDRKPLYFLKTFLDDNEGVAMFDFYSKVDLRYYKGVTTPSVVWYQNGDPVSKDYVKDRLSMYLQVEVGKMIDKVEHEIIDAAKARKVTIDAKGVEMPDPSLVNLNPLMFKTKLGENGEIPQDINPADYSKILVW